MTNYRRRSMGSATRGRRSIATRRKTSWVDVASANYPEVVLANSITTYFFASAALRLVGIPSNVTIKRTILSWFGATSEPDSTRLAIGACVLDDVSGGLVQAAASLGPLSQAGYELWWVRRVSHAAVASNEVISVVREDGVEFRGQRRIPEGSGFLVSLENNGDSDAVMMFSMRFLVALP